MHRIASVFILAVLAVACGSKAPATETPGNGDGSGTDEAPADSAGAVVTLVSLENGDRACYVGVKLADGTETSIEGDFGLCAGGANDASALIGQQVTYTTEKGNVLAAECEGDMDCGKSDEVDLVMTITAAP